MSSDKDNLEVVLEDMNGKFDAIMEILIPMRDQVAGMPSMKDDIREIKTDVKIIKAVLTEHSSQLNNHEARITHLEVA